MTYKPLPGFINHSDTPNCKLVESDDKKHLVVIKDVKKGQELTLKYQMYTV